MSERNYDFRQRHWQYHRKNMRDSQRSAAENEVMLDNSWRLGCGADSGSITQIAVKDFQDYLDISMELPLAITHTDGEKVLWVEVDESLERGFTVEVKQNHICLKAAADKMSFRGTIHLEDIMNLEGAPVLELGTMIRKPLYDTRIVHSGTGLDYYPDEELSALLHAGYDTIDLFLVGIDRNRIGYCDFNDIIERAARLGIDTVFHNYIQTYVHPDEPNIFFI